MVIKRVGPLSCAKITGLLYAVLGLVMGAFFSLLALAGGFASDAPGGAGMFAFLGVGAIVALPIFYGCLGFLSTLVAAVIYNAAAGVVGGVEMDVQ